MRGGLAASCLLVSLSILSAQPTFEVVSIRPNKDARAESHIDLQPSGRIVWTATTLRGLIGLAYQRTSFDERDVIGGPEWIERDRFDIIAQASGPLRVDPDGFPGPTFALIRAMLAERFQLRVHNDQRERPVYALVVAAPGKLGPQLVSSTVDCAAIAAQEARGVRIPLRSDGRRDCTMGILPGRYLGLGLGIEQLAHGLTRLVGRPVIDRTGLKGAYDWTVDYQQETAAPVGDRPSIFTALQEQLGLKLEATRGPVDVLVVDRAEPPTPD